MQKSQFSPQMYDFMRQPCAARVSPKNDIGDYLVAQRLVNVTVWAATADHVASL
jgi:hypothetical protein